MLRSGLLEYVCDDDSKLMIDPGLEGKIVLVTDGNSGIGAQVVRTFASHGARVVVHYLESGGVPCPLS